MTSADEVAKILDLEPHPSGCTGWFRQTFADPTTVDSANGKRAASTSIYFLQRKGMRSAFHRQRSAEVRPVLEFINCFLNKRCAMHSVHIILSRAQLGHMARVTKSKNFPDSKIFVAKTFRIKCVNLTNFQIRDKCA